MGGGVSKVRKGENAMRYARELNQNKISLFLSFFIVFNRLFVV